MEEGTIRNELKPGEFSREYSYESIKGIIRNNLENVARAFVTTGYYLRVIEERKLYLEDGYESLNDFALGEYGMGSTWVNRCIRVNERFSEDGYSPKIADQYRGYNKSQLTEMLPLSDERLEEVTPDMTVKQIRELKQPDPVEDPEEQIHGQVSIEDFPEMLPDTMIREIKTPDPKLEAEEQLTEEYEEDESLLCDFCINASSLTGNPDLCATCNGSSSNFMARCISGKSESGFCGAAAYCNEPVECCSACKEKCNGMCGWLEEEKIKKEEGSPAIDFKTLDKIIATSQEVHDEAWFVKRWAEEFPEELEKVMHTIRNENGDKAHTVQEYIAPYGCHCTSCSEYSFDFHGFSGGMDFRIGEESIHMKYGRFVRELEAIYPTEKEIATSQEKEEIHYNAGIESGIVKIEPDCSENDPDFGEIHPEEEASNIYTTRYFLEEQKKILDDYISVNKIEKMPEKLMQRQKIIVGALAAMVTDLELADELEDLKKKDQTELPILKNNDQRLAFIDAYRDWPVWIDTEETGERYYRYDLPDGCSFIVKEYHSMIFDHRALSLRYEDCLKEGWGHLEYYILKPGKFFHDCKCNRSELAEHLKSMQKKKEEK